MIRKASVSDVPGIADVIHWAHDHSVEAGKVTIDDTILKQLIYHAIVKPYGWVAVAPEEGKIEGVLVGIAQPYYGCCIEREATDIWWVGTDDCSTHDKVRLFIAFTDWAKENSKIKRIICGVTGLMGNDPERAEKILERCGMTRWGSVWRMEV